MQSLALKRKIVRQRNAQHAKDEHITVPQAKSQKAKQLLDKVLAGRKMSSLEAENYNKTPVEIQELTYEQAHQREEYYRGLMEKDPSGKTEQGAKSGELYVLYRDYAMSIATGEPFAHMNYDRLRQAAEVIIRWNSDLEAGVGSSNIECGKAGYGNTLQQNAGYCKAAYGKGRNGHRLKGA